MRGTGMWGPKQWQSIQVANRRGQVVFSGETKLEENTHLATRVEGLNYHSCLPRILKCEVLDWRPQGQIPQQTWLGPHGNLKVLEFTSYIFK